VPKIGKKLRKDRRTTIVRKMQSIKDRMKSIGKLYE